MSTERDESVRSQRRDAGNYWYVREWRRGVRHTPNHIHCVPLGTVIIDITLAGNRLSQLVMTRI